MLRFTWQGQPEHRDLPLPRYVQSTGFFRIWQVKSLAVFAAVNLCLFAPSLFYISASLLDDIIGVEPALEVSATEFSLLVLFITGTLIQLLDFHFVLGKLGDLRYRAGSGGQDLTSLWACCPNSPADLHFTRAFADKKARVFGTPALVLAGCPDKNRWSVARPASRAGF